MHHSPLIWTFSSRVLHIVETLAVRLPDVDLDAFDGLAGGVFDVAENEAGFAVRVVGDLGAVGCGLRFVRVERAQDGALGALWWFGVVNAVDKEGEAEDVREEDELLELLLVNYKLQSRAHDAPVGRLCRFGRLL